LGFTLLGHPDRSLALGSHPGLLPRAFRNPHLTVGPQRRLGVSLGLYLAPSKPPNKSAAARSNPYRVLAPGVPGHLSDQPSGLCVHLALRRALLSTVERSLNGSHRSTGVARGHTLGAEHLATPTLHQKIKVGRCCSLRLTSCTYFHFALQVFPPANSHMCYTPWSVLQDGSIEAILTKSPFGPSGPRCRVLASLTS
jgi:hypothetical protein